MVITNAETAIVMTIAVSTIAWGNGSVIDSGGNSPMNAGSPAGPIDTRNNRLTPLLSTSTPMRMRVRLRSVSR